MSLLNIQSLWIKKSEIFFPETKIKFTRKIKGTEVCITFSERGLLNGDKSFHKRQLFFSLLCHAVICNAVNFFFSWIPIQKFLFVCFIYFFFFKKNDDISRFKFCTLQDVIKRGWKIIESSRDCTIFVLLLHSSYKFISKIRFTSHPDEETTVRFFKLTHAGERFRKKNLREKKEQ